MLNNLLAWHRLPTVLPRIRQMPENRHGLSCNAEKFAKLTDGFMFALCIYTKRTFDAAEN